MDHIFKGDVQFWQRTDTLTAFFLGLVTLRVTSPTQSITLGDLDDDPEITVENLTFGVTEQQDFAEAFQVVAADGLDTVVLVAGQDPLSDSGVPLPERELWIDVGPERLPVPDIGAQFLDYVSQFEITNLTFDDAANDGEGAPITEGPFADGAELDLRDVAALEFLGRVGESLLPGDDDARKARAETVALIYEAALDRDGDVDEGGLNFWIDRAGDGLSDLALAAAFTSSPEFVAAFGEAGSLSDADYVETLYQNVLDRASDAAGFGFWTDVLELLDGNRDRLLLAFADSAENRANSQFVTSLAETDPGIWEFVA